VIIKFRYPPKQVQQAFVKKHMPGCLACIASNFVRTDENGCLKWGSFFFPIKSSKKPGFFDKKRRYSQIASIAALLIEVFFILIG